MEKGDQAEVKRGRRSRGSRLGRAAILLLLTYLLLSVLLSSMLLAPPPRLPGSGAAQGHEPSLFPKTWLDLAGGLRIPVWVAEPDVEPKGCVLLFHGIGGRHPEGRMKFVQSLGYVALAPDFRAHGEASGDRSGFGYREQAEVRATLALARRRWPDLPMAAWGFSLGAVAILFAADETAGLDGVILEAPYSSLERAFRNRFEHHLPGWLYPLTYGPVLAAEIRSGLWLDQIQPLRELPRFRADRVLLVQGERDWRVQKDEFEAFRKALPGVSALTLPGVGHQDWFWSAGEPYRQEIRRRLTGWLRR